jgi:hypothetical protein
MNIHISAEEDLPLLFYCTLSVTKLHKTVLQSYLWSKYPKQLQISLQEDKQRCEFTDGEPFIGVKSYEAELS